MRVLHVITGLDVGGAEQMLRRLILGGERNADIDHIVISLTTLGEIGEVLRAAGIVVETMGMRGARHVPSVIRRLRDRVRVLRPDIVQTWMYHADLIGGVAARLAGHRAIIWGIHATHLAPGAPASTRAARWLGARLSRRIPAAIVCVAESSHTAHEQLGYDVGRCVVIANGFEIDAPAVAPDQVREFRSGLGIAADEPVVGTVGRYDPHKDYPTLIGDAARVLRDRPQARFLMVGRGLDRANAELVASLERSGVAERFLLLGSRSDIPLCLAAMDIFVLSSRAEAFPLVVGEAMAAGLAVVVTDVGDSARVVGETGRVVPAQDPEALAVAITQVLASARSDRAALGARARERIRTEFSLERTRRLYGELYRRIAAEWAVT